MSIHFYLCVFLLTITILSSVNCQQPLQEYVVRKDFFSMYKATEYTVYDKDEQNIQYRVESTFHVFLQRIKVFLYPAKQEIGRLSSKLSVLTYKADFSILDPQSNQWIDGKIAQKFNLAKDLFYIEWGGNKITMEKNVATLTYKFFDTNGEVLAEYRIRIISTVWTNKYDMRIFSNKYPVQVYFLGLAACENIKKDRNIT